MPHPKSRHGHPPTLRPPHNPRLLPKTPSPAPTAPKQPTPPRCQVHHPHHNLRLYLDCPYEVSAASPSALAHHYYDHHAPQKCPFCPNSCTGNLGGGARIKAHHPRQWAGVSAMEKVWWATECHKHHYRLKRASAARAYRMAVETRRWASETRAKVAGFAAASRRCA